MKKLFVMLVLIFAIVTTSACSYQIWGGNNNSSQNNSKSTASTVVIPDSVKLTAKPNSGLAVDGTNITGNVTDNKDTISLDDTLAIPVGAEVQVFTVDANGNEVEVQDVDNIPLDQGTNNLHIIVKNGEETRDYKVVINRGNSTASSQPGASIHPGSSSQPGASNQPGSSSQPSASASTQPSYVRPSASSTSTSQSNPSATPSQKVAPSSVPSVDPNQAPPTNLDNGNGNGPVYNSDDVVIVDDSEHATENVRIRLSENDPSDIESINIQVFNKDNFRVNNRNYTTGWAFTWDENNYGVLILPADWFDGVPAGGSYKITINYKASSNIPDKVIDVAVEPIIINTPQEFQNINNDLSATYVLASDLDFKNFGNFMPIGWLAGQSNALLFTGKIYGNGHTISNLSINTAQCTPNFATNDGFVFNVGIIARLNEGALVDSLHIKDCSIKTNGMIVGMLTAVNDGIISNVLVENCSIEVAAGANGFFDFDCLAGGLVGTNTAKGTITSSIVYGTEFKGVGAPLIRAFAGKNWGTIANCVASCDGFALEDIVVDPAHPYLGENNNGVYSTSVNGELTAATAYGFTYLSTNKDAAGSVLGTLVNCFVYNLDGVACAGNYCGDAWGRWYIIDGYIPSLVPILTDDGAYAIAQDEYAMDPANADPTLYTTFAAFNKNDQKDIKIALTLSNANATVSKIRIGNGDFIYATENCGFTYSNGVLSLSALLLRQYDPSEMTLRIYENVAPSNGTVHETTLVIATKIIKTAADFQSINNDLAGVYVLANDIDMTGVNFQPIGYTGNFNATTGEFGNAFTGILEGAGHYVCNLSIDSEHINNVYAPELLRYEADGTLVSPSYGNCAFNIATFYKNGGVIRNVGFRDASVKASGLVVATVAAVNEGLIENVIVDGGKVQGGECFRDFNSFVAGLVGMNGGKIVNSVVAFTEIYGPSSLVRAFAGKNWGVIDGCYATTLGTPMSDLTGVPACDANNKQTVITNSQYGELTEATGYGFTYNALEYIDVEGVTTPFVAAPAIVFKCAILGADDLAEIQYYNNDNTAVYDTTVWEIADGKVPALKASIAAAHLPVVYTVDAAYTDTTVAPAAANQFAYFVKDDAHNVRLAVNANNVAKIEIGGYRFIYAGTNTGFTFANNVLTISKDLLATYPANDYVIRVYPTINNVDDVIEYNLILASNKVTNAHEFLTMSTDADKYYLVLNDIDFNGVAFTPIGLGNKSAAINAFKGTFNGAGHALFNINIDSATLTNTNMEQVNTTDGKTYAFNLGIFINNEGTIENLVVKNAHVTTSGLLVGMLAGVNNGTIKNVYVDGGKVTSTMSENIDASKIIPAASASASSAPANPYADTSLTGLVYQDIGLDAFIAGFVGINGGAGTIKNCISTVISIDGGVWTGQRRAFVGKNWGAIVNSYAASDNLVLSDYLLNAELKSQMNALGNGIVSNVTAADSLDASTMFGFVYRAGYYRNTLGITRDISVSGGMKTLLELSNMNYPFDATYWDMTRPGIIPTVKMLLGTGTQAPVPAAQAYEGTYSNPIVFVLSDPKNLNVYINNASQVFKIRVDGQNFIYNDGFTASGDVLTIYDFALSSLEHGYYDMSIYDAQGNLVEELELYVADYTVSTAQEFQNINNDLSAYYVLTSDIDFLGFGYFQPIGYTGNYNATTYEFGDAFTGAIEGAGHYVMNLTVDSAHINNLYAPELMGEDQYGPFSYGNRAFNIATIYKNSGIIRRLGFKDCNVTTNGLVTAVVAAVNEGLIEDVIVEGGVVTAGECFRDFNSFAAGLVGMNGGTINNSIVAMTEIYAPSALVRAFVGKNWGDINNCYASVSGTTMTDLTNIPACNATTPQTVISTSQNGELTASTLYGFTYNAREYINVAGVTPFVAEPATVTDSAVVTVNQITDPQTFANFEGTTWTVTAGNVPELIPFIGEHNFTNYEFSDFATDSTNYTPALAATIVNEPANMKISINLDNTFATIAYAHVDPGAIISKADMKYDSTNKILTIKGNAFMNLTKGYKTITFYSPDGEITSIGTINLFVAEYEINTANEFQNINNNLEGYYIVKDNLDLSTIANFEPIGSYKWISETNIVDNSFTGILEGAGHTIANVNINTESSSRAIIREGNNIGIFTSNKGTINNVRFANTSITSTGFVIGAVAGVNNGTINNVYVDGGNLVTRSLWVGFDSFIAGFVGTNGADGVITNSISTATSVQNLVSYHVAYTDEVTHQLVEYDVVDEPVYTTVRGFVGKNWGTIANSFAASNNVKTEELTLDVDKVAADPNVPAVMNVVTSNAGLEGFAYTATDFTKSTKQFSKYYGTITNCGFKTLDQMLASNLYTGYDSSVWTVSNNNMIKMNALFGAQAQNPVVAEAQNTDTYSNTSGAYYVKSAAGAKNVAVTIPTATLANVKFIRFAQTNFYDYGFTTSVSGSTLTLKIYSGLLANLATGRQTVYAYDGNGHLTSFELVVATDIIRNVNDFKAINTTDSSKYYVLANDIDFNGATIDPIGSVSKTTQPNPFKGTFDGAGFTLSNINIDTTASSSKAYYDTTAKAAYNVGVFAINDGIIKNVVFRNCNVKASGLILGVVAGTNRGTISNVYVNGGTITTTMAYNGAIGVDTFMAGVAGINGADGVIENVISTVTAINGDPWANKLTRTLVGKNWGTIKNAYAASDNITTQNWALTTTDTNTEGYYMNSIDSNSSALTYTAVDYTKGTLTIVKSYGTITDSGNKTLVELSTASTFNAQTWSEWVIENGKVPTLKRISGTAPGTVVNAQYNNVYTVNANDTIMVFDKSNMKDLTIGNCSGVSRVIISGGNVVESGYKVSGSTLTLSKELLNTFGIGEHTITVVKTNGSVITKVLKIVTKIITTTDEFRNMSTAAGNYYLLGNDLNFTNISDMRPIGHINSTNENVANEPSPFYGIFDGAGHTISNISLDMTSTKQTANVGIFGKNGGTIKDVTFMHCSVKLKGYIAGIVAGTNLDDGVIENVLVDGGSVNSTVNPWYDYNCFIAGFAGINAKNGIIRNCISTVNSIYIGTSVNTTTATKQWTRAFVGKTWGTTGVINDEDAYGGIFNCFAMSDGLTFACVTTGAGNSGTKAVNHTEDLGGFTYRAIDKSVTPNVQFGTLTNSSMKTLNEIHSGTRNGIYSNYATDVWTITGSALPQLNVVFTYNA